MRHFFTGISIAVEIFANSYLWVSSRVGERERCAYVSSKIRREVVQMRFSYVFLFATTSLIRSTCLAQLDPKPEDATVAVLRAFETHHIVIFR